MDKGKKEITDRRYLRLLAEKYPNSAAAKSEIINLSSILSLPKGTEYFFSDIHGEYEAFLNLLRSASGTIRDKITMLLSDSMTEIEQEELAQLVYFPVETLKRYGREELTPEMEKLTIYRLIKLCKELSSKYTRSKVRKKLPADYSYAIDELLNVDTSDKDKKRYFDEIVNAIVDTNAGTNFIIHLCVLAQQLAVDKLHIIGDIFDRGPRADIIMNELLNFPDVDVQWGNHDISWMGAACGNLALVANVVRIAVSYNNFDVLEDGYGINMRPLSMFASNIYKDDECKSFAPKIWDENEFDNVDAKLAAKMHKAIAIIQFKLEGQIIKRHPEYEMDDRNVLERINYKDFTVDIEGKTYKLNDTSFPTIDVNNPLQLTDGERELLNTLEASFKHSELLNRHVEFLYTKGSMYSCCNSNLLYHGCIPMNEDGTFTEVKFKAGTFKGKKMLDHINTIAKNAYYVGDESSVDFMWYLWCGKNSSVYGKSKMAAFENYFIDDKEAHKEYYNPYYVLSNSEDICDKIFVEFGLNPEHSHIINGHVPVKLKDGESPVKAGGKLYVIDGGISKAYRTRTGIAGYTLIYNSHHIALAEHNIDTNEKVLAGQNVDKQYKISPVIKITEPMAERVRVADTDIGKVLKERIEDLKVLINAYEEGIL
ncbi:MAG: fructose-1,6-bisphosphatase [Lachnospiraceae bacterium]